MSSPGSPADSAGSGAPTTTAVRLHRHVLDLERGTCVGEPSLTPLELRFLLRLAASAGDIVTRQTLLRDVWGYHPASTSRAIGAMVRRLRKKLEPDPDAPTLLLVVRGRGWKLNLGAAVRPVHEHSANLVDHFPSWSHQDIWRIEPQLDPGWQIDGPLMDAFERHGPDAVRLLGSLERDRTVARLSNRTEAEECLLSRLSVFSEGFGLEAMAAALGETEQFCLEALDVATQNGDVLPVDGGYRLLPSIRRHLVGRLTEVEWSAFDAWLVRPERVWLEGAVSVRRHATDAIEAVERHRSPDPNEALWLLLIDVGYEVPEYLPRVQLALERGPPEVRLLASALAGTASDVPPQVEEKARQSDLLCAYVCCLVDGERAELWLDCLEKARGPAWLELRVIEALACLPSFRSRFSTVRMHALRSGWHGAEAPLARAMVLHHVLHLRFERALAEGAERFPALHGLALFGVGADAEALELASRHPDVVPLAAVEALLSFGGDSSACRRRLAKLRTPPGALQVRDFRRLVLDQLDGIPLEPETGAFRMLLRSGPPAPGLRSSVMIAWIIAAKRGWLPLG